MIQAKCLRISNTIWKLFDAIVNEMQAHIYRKIVYFFNNNVQ